MSLYYCLMVDYGLARRRGEVFTAMHVLVVLAGWGEYSGILHWPVAQVFCNAL